MAPLHKTVFEVKTFFPERAGKPVKVLRIRGSLNQVKRYATTHMVDSTTGYVEVLQDGKRVAFGRAFMNNWSSMRVCWKDRKNGNN